MLNTPPTLYIYCCGHDMSVDGWRISGLVVCAISDVTLNYDNRPTFGPIRSISLHSTLNVVLFQTKLYVSETNLPCITATSYVVDDDCWRQWGAMSENTTIPLPRARCFSQKRILQGAMLSYADLLKVGLRYDFAMRICARTLWDRDQKLTNKSYCILYRFIDFVPV